MLTRPLVSAATCSIGVIDWLTLETPIFEIRRCLRRHCVPAAAWVNVAPLVIAPLWLLALWLLAVWVTFQIPRLASCTDIGWIIHHLRGCIANVDSQGAWLIVNANAPATRHAPGETMKLLLALAHHFPTTALLAIPSTFVKTIAISLVFLVHARLLVMSLGPQILTATSGIRVVDRFPLIRCIRQICRGLRKHWDIAVAGIDLTPLLRTPSLAFAWILVLFAARMGMPVIVPCLTSSSKVSGVVSRCILVDDDSRRPIDIVEADTRAFLASIMRVTGRNFAGKAHCTKRQRIVLMARGQSSKKTQRQNAHGETVEHENH